MAHIWQQPAQHPVRIHAGKVFYMDEGQVQAALVGTPHAGINGIRTKTEIPTPAQGTRRDLITPSFRVKDGWLPMTPFYVGWNTVEDLSQQGVIRRICQRGCSR